MADTEEKKGNALPLGVGGAGGLAVGILGGVVASRATSDSSLPTKTIEWALDKGVPGVLAVCVCIIGYVAWRLFNDNRKKDDRHVAKIEAIDTQNGIEVAGVRSLCAAEIKAVRDECAATIKTMRDEYNAQIKATQAACASEVHDLILEIRAKETEIRGINEKFGGKIEGLFREMLAIAQKCMRLQDRTEEALRRLSLLPEEDDEDGEGTGISADASTVPPTPTQG